MTNKLFGDATENRTTSEVGVEPTTIVVRTTDNSNVGETKTEDVVKGFLAALLFSDLI